MAMQQQAMAWVVGRTAALPELSGQDQSYRARLRVLNNRGFRNRETREWVDLGPNGTDVICWGELARNVAASIQKGDPVVVYGRLEDNSWTDKEGATHRNTRVVAELVAHDLAWGSSRFTRTNNSPVRGGAAEIAGSNGHSQDGGAAAVDAAVDPSMPADPWEDAEVAQGAEQTPEPSVGSLGAGQTSGVPAESDPAAASAGPSRGKAAKEREPAPF